MGDYVSKDEIHVRQPSCDPMIRAQREYKPHAKYAAHNTAEN